GALAHPSGGHWRSSQTLLNDDSRIADSGVHGIQRQNGMTGRVAFGGDLFAEHQARIFVAHILFCGDDVAYDFGQNHFLNTSVFDLWSLVFDLWSVFRPNQNSKTKVQRPKSYVVTCFSESTIPTIVQSVGVSSRLKVKLASFPRHQKTNSPTPAPTESIATMGLPCASRFLFSD